VNELTNNSAETDQELVRRVQRGDKSAFDCLVRKYQHKIIMMITRYLKDPSEAQDVAQDAFIKAYRALPNFRGESAFYTWLYRIAANSAKTHLASKGRKYANQAVDIDEAEKLANAPQLQGLDTPEQELANQQIIQVINDAIEDLPDDMRMAIILREFDGMNYEEIALTMDCPIGTVRSRIFRAREAIDNKLAPLLN